MAADFPCILVTTDFSELGNSAVPRAFRLAARLGQRLVLVHVLEDGTPNPLYAHYQRTLGPDERRQLERRAREELERLAPGESPGFALEIQLGQGSPAAEICRIACECQAALVVISSHGRTGVKHFMLGSVAERVVHQAPCSVLVLRPERCAPPGAVAEPQRTT
jgi:nucleotide-binding universal stress UspA family protein